MPSFPPIIAASSLSRSFPNILAFRPLLLLTRPSPSGTEGVIAAESCNFASRSLRLLFALARNDFDLLGFNAVRIVQFELDVLDDERPDLIAEAVGVEVPLGHIVSACPISLSKAVFVP